MSEQFRVVINDEDQYSIWSQEMAIPPGWRDAGFSGTRDECLEYITGVWTDLRPKSLRAAVEEI